MRKVVIRLLAWPSEFTRSFSVSTVCCERQKRRNPYEKTTRPQINKEVREQQKMAKTLSLIQRQNFDFFLVLDFEATCLKERRIRPQEVIELPVLKVDAKTFDVISTFHQYVEPQVHKELSPFCSELTGIIQEMVNGQPSITDALKSLDEWMKSERLLEPDVKSVFVTCGDWDLKTMLPGQAGFFKFTYPDYFKHWINIKKPYSNSLGKYPQDMMMMLNGLGLEHEGRHHSGIDDCKNIARILKELGLRGCILKETGSLVS